MKQMSRMFPETNTFATPVQPIGQLSKQGNEEERTTQQTNQQPNKLDTIQRWFVDARWREMLDYNIAAFVETPSSHFLFHLFSPPPSLPLIFSFILGVSTKFKIQIKSK